MGKEVGIEKVASVLGDSIRFSTSLFDRVNGSVPLAKNSKENDEQDHNNTKGPTQLIPYLTQTAADAC